MLSNTNAAAAKLALVAFTKTLALEGKKYNIHANVIAPMGEWNSDRRLIDQTSLLMNCSWQQVDSHGVDQRNAPNTRPILCHAPGCCLGG
jgi:NAD(P)-dependent dehydrogenase (short-subunit alcohol dehydrogenase family)